MPFPRPRGTPHSWSLCPRPPAEHSPPAPASIVAFDPPPLSQDPCGCLGPPRHSRAASPGRDPSPGHSRVSAMFTGLPTSGPLPTPCAILETPRTLLICQGLRVPSFGSLPAPLLLASAQVGKPRSRAQEEQAWASGGNFRFEPVESKVSMGPQAECWGRAGSPATPGFSFESVPWASVPPHGGKQCDSLTCQLVGRS